MDRFLVVGPPCTPVVYVVRRAGTILEPPFPGRRRRPAARSSVPRCQRTLHARAARAWRLALLARLARHQSNRVVARHTREHHAHSRALPAESASALWAQQKLGAGSRAAGSRLGGARRTRAAASRRAASGAFCLLLACQACVNHHAGAMLHSTACAPLARSAARSRLSATSLRGSRRSAPTTPLLAAALLAITLLAALRGVGRTPHGLASNLPWCGRRCRDEALGRMPSVVTSSSIVAVAALSGASSDEGGQLAACLAAVREVCDDALGAAALLSLAAHSRCTSPSAVRDSASALGSVGRRSFCMLLNDMAVAEGDPKSATLTKLAFTAVVFELAQAHGGSFELHESVMRTYGALLGVRYRFDAAAMPWPKLPAVALLDQRGALDALAADGVVQLMQLAPAVVRRIVAGLSTLEFLEKDHLGAAGGTYPSVYGIRPDLARPESTFYILRDANEALRLPDVARLVLEPRLLTLAQAALGVAPILSRVDIWWTRRRTSDAGAAESVRDFQAFHRDFNFVRSFKLFLYLSDVTSDTGPYQYVAGSYASTHGMRGPADGEFYAEKEVRKAFPADAVREVTGNAGLLFMAAATTLHRGKPIAAPDGHRAIMQFEFTGSLLGGTDGGFVVPLLRIPLSLAPLYERYPRVFARIKAGYLTFADARPSLAGGSDAEPDDAAKATAPAAAAAPPPLLPPSVIFVTLARHFEETGSRLLTPNEFFTAHGPEFLRLTVPALRAYCARHGYGFEVETSQQRFAALDRQVGWTKMPLLRATLAAHPHARWVAWIDADTLPLNVARGMEAFIEQAEREDKHVVLHPQCGTRNSTTGFAGTTDGRVISTALLLIRNSERGRAFLTHWETRVVNLRSAAAARRKQRARNEETDELNALVRWYAVATEEVSPLLVLPANSIMTWISISADNPIEASTCYSGRCFPLAPWMAANNAAQAAVWAAHEVPAFVTFPGHRKPFVVPYHACVTGTPMPPRPPPPPAPRPLTAQELAEMLHNASFAAAADAARAKKAAAQAAALADHLAAEASEARVAEQRLVARLERAEHARAGRQTERGGGPL